MMRMAGGPYPSCSRERIGKGPPAILIILNDQYAWHRSDPSYVSLSAFSFSAFLSARSLVRRDLAKHAARLTDHANELRENMVAVRRARTLRREAVIHVNRPREITPLCGKPKTREQNRCTSGSVSRRLGFGENRAFHFPAFSF